MNILEARNISKAFGGIQALTACSISVKQGSITGLIGPNGSGKTTLFNVITGYEQAHTGMVSFKGKSIKNLAPEKLFDLGIGRTFQLTRIFPRLTVLENMHVAVQRTGVKGLMSRWSSSHHQGKALQLLNFVGIGDFKDRHAGELSYGQKKLLELAFVLVADPQVVLLDEPAGGINATMIHHLEDLIRILNQRGVTFLIVEHNMEFVMELCTAVMVLHRGTTIAEGTPEEVRNNQVVLDAYLGE